MHYPHATRTLPARYPHATCTHHPHTTRTQPAHYLHTLPVQADASEFNLHENDGGWVKGRKDGAEGVFPSNYVQRT